MMSLAMCGIVALACSPGRITDRRSTPDDSQGASPSPGNTNKTGALQISLSQELSSSISSALVESGLTDAQVQAVTTEVKATGVIAIDTGAAGLAAEPGLSLNTPGSHINLSDYSLAEQTSALQTTAPSVAGAYVASLDAPAAELSEEIRKNAIGIVTTATFDFTGKKAMDDSSRSVILGDIAQRVVEKTSEASLSPDLLEEAVGVIANATFANMERAGIPASSIGDTAKTLGAKIGEGLGKSGIQADRLPTALGIASEKASTALGKLSLSDPVAAIGSTTEGFVAGLAANASVSREIRMAAIAEVPKGISTAVPAWLPADKLENAVAQVTTSSFTTFIDKLSPSAAEISDQAPRLAESSVTGLTRSGATAATLAASNVTAKPFQAIVEKMDSVGIDSTTRLKVVENTLSKSISALASSTDADKLNTVAPQLVSRAFEIATASRAKLGIDQTEAKVTSFYDTLLNGAIGGLAKAGSTQQAGTASAASSVLAKTMDAAVSSLNSMYTGTGAAISENILKSIPTRAAQSAGEKLATVLPPDDLNGAFATVTTQYLFNVQSVVATKATNVDVSDLTKKVTATSLASFSGAFNARPVDMQTAVTALNNKMGVVGSAMDAKILAAVQGGTQEVVVNAVQSAGNMVGCSGATPNATLVVCSKVSTDICPIATSENGYNLKWVADGTGERCFLYREVAVTTSQAVTCASDSEYVYGIGCRRKVSTCAAGETFVYGVGCQAGTYFCSVGQKFLAGKGCVTDTADYSQCSDGTRRTADGNCVAIVATNCPIGATFNPVSKKCDAAATPQCPAGSTYNAGTSTCTVTIATDIGSTTTACAAGFYRSSGGACLPFGRCDTGSYWDPSSLSCKSSASCTGNFQWDAGTNICRAKDLVAALCPTGQFWDPTTQQCKSSTNCPADSSWDATARVCRPTGTCAIGFAYNPTNGTCDAVAQATVSECLASASAPGTPTLTVTPAVQSLGLSWAPAIGETPTGYVLIRWDSSAGALNLAEGKAYNIGDTVGSETTLGKVIFRGKVTFFNDSAASDSTKEYAYSLVAANIPCTGPKYSTADSVSGQKPLAAPTGTVPTPVAPSNLSASSKTDQTFQKRALLKWNAPLYVFDSQSIEPDFVIARIYDPSITPDQLKSFFAVDKQSYWQGSNIFNGSAAIGVVVFSGKLWRNTDSSKPNYAFLDNQSSGSVSGRYAIATKIGAGTSSVYSTIEVVNYTAPSATEAVSVPKVTDLSVIIPTGASKPRVKWSPVNGASGYIIARAPSSLAALPSLVNDTFYDVNQGIIMADQTVATVIGELGQTWVDDVNVTIFPGNTFTYLVYTVINIDGKPKYSPGSSFIYTHEEQQNPDSTAFTQMWSSLGQSNSPYELKKIAISGGKVLVVGQSLSNPSTPYRADFDTSNGEPISNDVSFPSAGILKDVAAHSNGYVAVGGTKLSDNGAAQAFVSFYLSSEDSSPNSYDWSDSPSEVQALAWDDNSLALYVGGKSGTSSFQIRKYVRVEGNGLMESENNSPFSIPSVSYGSPTPFDYTINLIRRMVINNGNIILLADAVNDSATPSRISVLARISFGSTPPFTHFLIRPIIPGNNLLTDFTVDAANLYFVSSSAGQARLEKFTLNASSPTPTSLNIYPADPNSSFTAGYTSIIIDGNGKLVVGGWIKEKSAGSFKKGLFSRFATTGTQDPNLPKIWGGNGVIQFGDEMVTTILTDENKDIYVGGSTYTTATSVVERLIKFSGN